MPDGGVGWSAYLREACRIASKHADEVDDKAQFPVSALDYIRDSGLLALAVPKAMGGNQASLKDLADACFMFGRSCGSTALVFAMHQIQIGLLTNCLDSSEAAQELLMNVARQKWLIASSTTETARPSRSHEGSTKPTAGDFLQVNRSAAVISYFDHADAVLVLDPLPDQDTETESRLLIAMKAQIESTRCTTWSGLGLRGTGTHSYMMKMQIPRRQSIDIPYSLMDGKVAIPMAHCLLASVWAGIASLAIHNAQSVVTRKGRNKTLLLDVIGRFQMILDTLTVSIRVADELLEQPFETEIYDADMRRFILLKTTCSNMLTDIGVDCLKLSGISGYQTRATDSVSRPLRDLLSAPVMVSNFKILDRAADLVELPIDAMKL